jgi:PAS domain S-box-containing protein
MELALRDSGIDIIGKVPMGTHFCLFYKTKEDLIDTLIPYFEAGLKNNEFCMCITSEPFNAEEVKERMQKAIPRFNKYLTSGQIEILPYTEWYVIDGIFDHQRVMDGWVEKLHKAHARGFDGMRLTGNTFWLEKYGWNDFQEYERDINDSIGNYPMIALCTYSTDKCGANEILDVVSTHQFALSKYEGKWKVIENTDLKEARKELHERESMLQGFFNAANVFLSVIELNDSDFIFKMPNCRMAELFGLDIETMQGKSARQIGLSEEFIREWIDRFRYCQRIGNTINVEYTITHNGNTTWHQGSVSPIQTEDGDGNIFCITSTEITERKRTEDVLKDAKMQTELYLDLMGHDINNMNQVAMGYLEIARDSLHMEESEYEYLEKPLDSLRRSSELIDNVRKLRLAKAGDMKFEIMDLREVALSICKEYSLIQDKTLCFETHVEGKCPVMANYLLTDVLSNLVGNAVKHSNGDRANVVIGLENISVDGKAYYKVSVVDEGPGIPDDMKELIFNRLQRGSTKAKGMGLGLYLVRTLVESYRGKVWVEDRVQGDHTKGSRFIVMLPAAMPAMPSREAAPQYPF